jgi:hypothetical protein
MDATTARISNEAGRVYKQILPFRLVPLVLLTLMGLVLMLGCKKERDMISPEVEIFTPKQHEAFTMGDSVFVSGIASDETMLTSVVVTLTDEQFIVRDHQVNLTVISNPQPFSFWYDLTNKHLPEGDYYIQVRASDGTNTRYKYRRIRLTQGPLSLRSVVVVTRSGEASFALSTLDTSSLQLHDRRQWNHAYAGSGISQPANHIVMLGKEIGACYAVDLDDHRIKFQIPPIGTPSLQHYQNLLVTPDRFFTGLTDGYVKGYNNVGQQQFVTELTTGRKPVVLALHPPYYLVMVEQERFGPGSWVTATFLDSGLPWKGYKLPDGFQAVAVLPLSYDEVIIAGNLNGEGRLIIWNITLSSISTPWQHPEPFSDMISMGANQLLVAAQNGILLFQMHQPTPQTFIAHPGALRLKTDPGKQILYVGTQQSLTAYLIASKGMLWQVQLPNQLADFHLHYQ